MVSRSTNLQPLMCHQQLWPWLWSLLGVSLCFRVLWLHRIPGINGDEAWYGVQVQRWLAGGSSSFLTPSRLPVNPMLLVTEMGLLRFVGPSFADPGRLFMAVHLAAALLCSRLTWTLVRLCLNGARWQPLLYLWVMWGGGLFSLSTLIENLCVAKPALFELLRHDPGSGWWFLNWGRNLVYPTESVYHALMAATWIAVLRERWLVALWSAALLASTHPFSGLQVLLILAAWCAISLRLRPSWRVPLWFSGGTVSLLVLFLSYNLLFLGLFEQHRELVRNWSVKWTLDWAATWRAYLPLAAIAAVRCWRERGQMDRTARFLLTCWATSFLLANHDWFVRPHQPVHFTRGYIWMPLCLLGLPMLEGTLLWLSNTRRRLFCGLVPLLLAAVLAVSDNAAFLVQYAQRRAEYGFFLTPAVRDLFRQMREHDLRGVLLPPNPRLGYLLAVYTRARPYLGLAFNTPSFYERQRQMMDWFANGQGGPWFSIIDYVLVPRVGGLRHGSADRWREVLANDEWTLLECPRAGVSE
ncbi:MAG: hypothetical protein HY000_31925 [Planctomycetes bacterium]|nr:hypothetical protein [Planctomycetota bacterium]